MSPVPVFNNNNGRFFLISSPDLIAAFINGESLFASNGSVLSSIFVKI